MWSMTHPSHGSQGYGERGSGSRGTVRTAPRPAPGVDREDRRVDEARAPGTSRTVDLGGPVHVVDYGGAPDGPAVVLGHGLGGSHGNWDLFAPLRTSSARVWALDLPGFGRSEPGERRASVPANVAVLQRFLREVVGEPVVLVGNSMGGMISLF